MIVKMSKVEIVGDREFLHPVTNLLYDLGVCQLDNGPETEILKKAQLSEEEKEEQRNLIQGLSIIREMEKNLGEFPVYDKPIDLPDPIDKLMDIKTEYLKYRSELHDLREKMTQLQDYRNILKALSEIIEETEISAEEFIGITFPKSESRIIELIKKELEELTGGEFKITTTEMRGDRIAGLITVPPKFREKFREILREEGLNELVLPEEYRSLPLKESIAKIEKDLTLLPHEIEKKERALLEFKDRVYEQMRKIKTLILDRYSVLKAKEEYPIESQLLFYLKVWVPDKDVKRLKESLKEQFGDNVHIEIKEPHVHEYQDVPVKVENKGILRPFQTLLQIFQPPIYGTIDPTPFLYMFFPIYFGFMLGDIGYGAIGTLLFGFLWLKTKPGTLLRSVANIFLWAMLWTFIFGILYGEFLGDLGERLGMHPLLVHRTHEVRPVLATAVLFGVVQVLLGIFLGAINQFRLGHKKHAYFEVTRFLGLLGLVFALVMPIIFLIAGWSGWPSILIKIGAVLLILSVPVLVKLHNFVAPLEVLSAMGNMFSFARLMAIGLSSAILGMIANMFNSIIGAFIFGLLVALIFHGLNVILGIFDPTVQGLRLQFVEFFSKFYLTGGRPYKPFKRGGK